MTAFLKRSVTAVPVSILAVLALMALAAVPTQANGSGSGGQTTTTQLPFHGDFTNLCNGDVANLSGTLTITQTTRPAAHGYILNSRSSIPDLKGATVLPLPGGVPYTGQDVEQNHQYVADPPYPSTVSDLHYTKLVPHPSGPIMYLVVVTRTVVLADGTAIPTIDRIYLTCAQPCNERNA